MKNNLIFVSLLLPLILSTPLKAMEKNIEEPRHLPTKSKLREVLKTHQKEFQFMINNYQESSLKPGSLSFQDGDQEWKISAPQVNFSQDFLAVLNDESFELIYNTLPKSKGWALAQFGRYGLNHLVFHLQCFDLPTPTKTFVPFEKVMKEEKEISLSNVLNFGFNMDEEADLPKGWNLVDSLRNRDVNNSISLKKKRVGIEILGDNYTFHVDVPSLKNFDKTIFVFSADVRSTNPGVFIQYYDGKNAVSSKPYANQKGEWETLKVEFTVDANARFHRLYSAILGPVRGNAKPSVDLNNVMLQQKQIAE